MKLLLISFTGQGEKTARRLAEGLSIPPFPERAGGPPEKEGSNIMRSGGPAGVSYLGKEPGYSRPGAGYQAEAFCFRDLKMTLGEFAKQAFRTADGLIFVGAAGIAVRAIAPYIKEKSRDPAVVVVDELGQFAIPVLSGHLGGANELARDAARILGAIPVITTATDLRQAFAVDLFAKKNGLVLEEIAGIKEISSAVLAGERIGFFSDYATEGAIPGELTPGIRQRCNLYITQREKGFPELLAPEREAPENQRLLRLIPRNAVLGMGCKRGVSPEAAKRAAEEALCRAGISRLALCALATVEQKREEEALRALAEKWELEFRFFPARELEAVRGSFAESEFVRGTVGVGNVCERAAVLLAGLKAEGQGCAGGAAKTHLLAGKTVAGGVTAAIAAAKNSPVIRFDRG